MLALIAAAVLTAQSGVSACRVDQLIASFDGRDGAFNGMSHSGTLMVLRNKSTACRIRALPQVRFTDAHGRALSIERKLPVEIYGEPATMQIIVTAGGVVSAPLRWISGPVYDPGRCLRTARIAIRVDGKALSPPFRATVCGPADKPATFDQPPLRSGLNVAP